MLKLGLFGAATIGGLGGLLVLALLAWMQRVMERLTIT